ncbi:MAG: LamG domain-containing protein [Candidatus Bathyarchaeota archaeon]|nr:LamG domain-containing protein [Candidatus Bathyarchaeota archaeon]
MISGTFLLCILLHSCEKCDCGSEVAANLIAYYAFDGNANDLSGNGHHGTVYGAELIEDRNGKTDCAYYFDGSLDYIDLGSSSELKRYKSNYTVTGWIKLESYPPTYNSIILSYRNNQTASVSGSFIGIGGLQSSLSKRVEFVQNASVTEDEFTYDFMSSNTQLEIDTWYFFAVSYEYNGNLTNTIKIYLNGNLESQKLMGEIIDPEDVPSYLGCEPALSPTDYSYHGSMDEIRIYDQALSAEEISKLLNI